jgi:hypothetical protein
MEKEQTMAALLLKILSGDQRRRKFLCAEELHRLLTDE